LIAPPPQSGLQTSFN